MNKYLNFYVGGYILAVISLFFYSYTQVDLALTLTRMSFVLDIVRGMQQVGFYHRPLSTLIYIIVLSLLFLGYIFFIKAAQKGILTKKKLWILLLIITPILTLSYNAFSYDLFNYIFDAKIITFYGDNPYLQKALDYPGDPMLGFMHWTHRVYPYGPIWLAFTLPLSFLGFQLFLPTLFLFKIAIAGAFLGMVKLVERISDYIDENETVTTMVFFALNPLILIESLVSSHNDLLMLFLALLSLSLLMKKRYIKSFFSLILSVGVKFATIFVLPLYIMVYLSKKAHTKEYWQSFFLYATLLMALAAVAATIRSNFQPWYLLYPLAYAVFLQKNKYSLSGIFITTIMGLLNYIPFLYFGGFDEPVPSILLYINILCITITGFVWGKIALSEKHHKKFFK